VAEGGSLQLIVKVGAGCSDPLVALVGGGDVLTGVVDVSICRECVERLRARAQDDIAPVGFGQPVDLLQVSLDGDTHCGHRIGRSESREDPVGERAHVVLVEDEE
jgi:hypothetical protein